MYGRQCYSTAITGESRLERLRSENTGVEQYQPYAISKMRKER